MKHNTKTLILRLGLVLSVAAAIVPAQARSVTGFASAKIEITGVTTNDANLCVVEDNGAVVNLCTYPVNLVFNLPIDYTGTHSVAVQDLWLISGYPTSFSFQCDTYVYAGTGQGSLGTGNLFTAPGQTLQLPVTVANGGESIQLICWQVPEKTGIANINWSE